MDNWLYLNKRPCWDSIRDPLMSKANPWTAGLRYLVNAFLISLYAIIFLSQKKLVRY